MKFLDTRNLMMEQLGWDRQVATLATRLSMGVDTWKSIAACPSFWGNPLLTVNEAKMIRDTIGGKHVAIKN